MPSLVGSEMCIRDRSGEWRGLAASTLLLLLQQEPRSFQQRPARGNVQKNSPVFRVGSGHLSGGWVSLFSTLVPCTWPRTHETAAALLDEYTSLSLFCLCYPNTDGNYRLRGRFGPGDPPAAGIMVKKKGKSGRTSLKQKYKIKKRVRTSSSKHHQRPTIAVMGGDVQQSLCARPALFCLPIT